MSSLFCEFSLQNGRKLPVFNDVNTFPTKYPHLVLEWIIVSYHAKFDSIWKSWNAFKPVRKVLFYRLA